MELPPFHLYRNEKVQCQFSKQEHRERNLSKIPFVEEGFGISLRRRDFLGCFWGGFGGAVSSSNANEPESNKFSTCFGAQVTPLKPAEVEDVFLPATLMLTIESFLAGLSPEYFAANLLLHFKG
jgi:hypothetical protein